MLSLFLLLAVAYATARSIEVIQPNIEPKVLRQCVLWEQMGASNNRPAMRYTAIASHPWFVDHTVSVTAAQFSLDEVHDTLYTLIIEHAYKSWTADHYPSQYTTPDHPNGIAPIMYRLPFAPTWAMWGEDRRAYRYLGAYAEDPFTVIHPHTYTLALASVQVVVNAVEHLFAQTYTSTQAEKRIIYAQTILPGHHASNHSYGGYSFLNNIMFGAYHALRHVRRVAILDLDNHAGHGTEQLANAWKESNLLSISIHADPEYEYPFYYGDESTPYHTNYPVPNGANFAVYRRFGLEPTLAQISAFHPDVLLVAFGFDTYQHDPESLRDIYGHSLGCQFDLRDYTIMGSLVSQLNVSTIVVPEGGYNLTVASNITRRFLFALGLS